MAHLATTEFSTGAIKTAFSPNFPRQPHQGVVFGFSKALYQNGVASFQAYTPEQNQPYVVAPAQAAVAVAVATPIETETASPEEGQVPVEEEGGEEEIPPEEEEEEIPPEEEEADE